MVMAVDDDYLTVTFGTDQQDGTRAQGERPDYLQLLVTEWITVILTTN